MTLCCPFSFHITEQGPLWREAQTPYITVYASVFDKGGITVSTAEEGSCFE